MGMRGFARGALWECPVSLAHLASLGRRVLHNHVVDGMDVDSNDDDDDDPDEKFADE